MAAELIRVGYPCKHLGLPATTNHTIRLASLTAVENVRAKIKQNLDDLEAILFRIGQQLIPFASQADFSYDWQRKHGTRQRALGLLARRLGQRLSLHPGQYINPGNLHK